MPSKAIKKTDKYHHGNLKEAMLKVGIETISKEGLSALSLKKIATELNVSIGAPYRHFPTRDHFIAHVSERGFSILNRNYEAKIGEYSAFTPEELFETYTNLYFDFAVGHPAYYRTMFTSALPESYKYDFLFETGTRAFCHGVDLAKHMQKKSVFKKANPIEQAIIIWSAMHGFTSLYIDSRMRFLEHIPESKDLSIKSLYKNQMGVVYKGLLA